MSENLSATYSSASAWYSHDPPMHWRQIGFPIVLLALAWSTTSSCGGSVVREAETLTGGNVERGRSAIGKYGCAACHTIPGIEGATATVGPPLNNIAVRGFLGGHLPNTPGNMMKWIQHPQAVDPKNVMPDLGITDQDARDVAAYLYTLR